MAVTYVHSTRMKTVLKHNTFENIKYLKYDYCFDEDEIKMEELPPIYTISGSDIPEIYRGMKIAFQPVAESEYALYTYTNKSGVTRIGGKRIGMSEKTRRNYAKGSAKYGMSHILSEIL